MSASISKQGDAPDFKACLKISHEERSIFSSQKSGTAPKVFIKTFG